MNPLKVNRDNLTTLTDLPNIGRSIANDLNKLGIFSPEELKGKDPAELFKQLSKIKGKKQDPCLLDVFISITDFMNGNEPKVWWEYTNFRKTKYSSLFQ